MFDKIFMCSGNNISVMDGMWIVKREQKFSKEKSIEADKVYRIAIDSQWAEVNVLVSDSSKIEVKLYGSAYADGDFRLDIQKEWRNTEIKLKFIGVYYKGNLKLDVILPKRKFEELEVCSFLGEIKINEDVKVEKGRTEIQNIPSDNEKSWDIPSHENENRNSQYYQSYEDLIYSLSSELMNY